VDSGWFAVRTLPAAKGRGTSGWVCFAWVWRPRWRSTA